MINRYPRIAPHFNLTIERGDFWFGNLHAEGISCDMTVVTQEGKPVTMTDPDAYAYQINITLLNLDLKETYETFKEVIKLNLPVKIVFIPKFVQSKKTKLLLSHHVSVSDYTYDSTQCPVVLKDVQIQGKTLTIL